MCLRDLPWIEGPADRAAIAGIDHVQAVFRYRYPIADLIRAAKFQRDLAAAQMLGQLMAWRLATGVEQPHVLVPVPLFWRRLCWRGFNQTVELTRPLAAKLGVDMDTHSAARVRGGAPRATLPTLERRRRLHGVFEARGDFKRRRVVIIDDVLTTGATAAALARVLRQRGAARVELWVCARA